MPSSVSVAVCPRSKRLPDRRSLACDYRILSSAPPSRTSAKKRPCTSGLASVNTWWSIHWPDTPSASNWASPGTTKAPSSSPTRYWDGHPGGAGDTPVGGLRGAGDSAGDAGGCMRESRSRPEAIEIQLGQKASSSSCTMSNGQVAGNVSIGRPVSRMAFLRTLGYRVAIIASRRGRRLGLS